MGAKYSIISLIAFLGLAVTGCESPYDVAFEKSAVTAPESGSTAPTSGGIQNRDTTQPPSVTIEGGGAPGTDAGCLPVRSGLMGFSGLPLDLKGGATISDDVYTFKNVNVKVTGQASMGGTLFADLTSSTVEGLNGKPVQQVNLALEAEVKAYASSLAQLAPHKTIGAITNSLMIQGGGGLNVIKVSGDISLTEASALLFKGSLSDVFVINVYGSVNIAGQASIKAAEGSGVLARNIIFNAVGTGGGLGLNGGGIIIGTYMSTERSAVMGGNGEFHGALYAKGITASGAYNVWESVSFCNKD